MSLNLKEALQESLVVYFGSTGSPLPIETDLRTGVSEINIFEINPDTPPTIPSVSYEIASSRPLVNDFTASSCFRSKVLIYIVTFSSPLTTKVGDWVVKYLTKPEQGKIRSSWFRDISTDCILNKYTTFVRRYSGKPRHSFKSETYLDVVEADFIWCDCICEEEVECNDTVNNLCPADTVGDQYVIEDDCC